MACRGYDDYSLRKVDKVYDKPFSLGRMEWSCDTDGEGVPGIHGVCVLALLVFTNLTPMAVADYLLHNAVNFVMGEVGQERGKGLPKANVGVAGVMKDVHGMPCALSDRITRPSW